MWGGPVFVYFEFYFLFFVVLNLFSLHEVWVLSLDFLFPFFFPPNLVSLIISVKDPILPVCLALFPVVLQYFCVFQLFIESLCFSAFFFFVLFFEVYIHSYTSWSCIQPSIHVLLVKRQRKSPLPRISTFWPREMCPEELYADGRQLVCLFCC